MKLLRYAAFLLSGLATGCANGHFDTKRAVSIITPETGTIGLTAPNLISGPISNTKGPMEARRDSTGVIGVTVSATYRFKAIQIERNDVQPVRIVKAIPVASPSPTPLQ